MLLAAMGTACGGGAGTHSTVEQTTTRRSAPSITTTVVLARPTVIDRGTDYGSIVGSLVLFVRWLEWHNPDPGAGRPRVPAREPPERVASEHVTELRRTGAHIVEADRAPLDFTIISVKPNVVSLRLTEHLSHRELIAANGRVLARDGARTEHYLISIARWNAEAPWRVNLVERQSPKIEVQL